MEDEDIDSNYEKEMEELKRKHRRAMKIVVVVGIFALIVYELIFYYER